MAPLLQLAAIALSIASSVSAFDIRMGRKVTTNQARKEAEQRRASTLVKRDDSDLETLFPAHNLSVPVDHFHNESRYEPHSNATFPLRYFFDATYYQEGGPVIVIQSGETSATDRLPYLQKGIAYQLSKATGGIGVILEHRYYGTSFPVPDLSTKNLRFLTTQQALADEAYFAQNIQFPGLEKYDLTSKSIPWISYGGSYPGAFSAFLRVQYPDIFWGSISSSGVTKAIYDYWQYYIPIIENGPSNCIDIQQTLVQIFDNIWIDKNDITLSEQLKATLGFTGLTHDQDLASALTTPISDWQELNWDPAVTEIEFYSYCANITASKLLYPQTEESRANVTNLLKQAGFAGNTTLENAFLNLIGYSNLTLVSPCYEGNQTLDQCYSTFNQTFYDLDSIELASYKSWPYQTCTEWGFFQTGNIPPGWQTRPIISRTIDAEYSTVICRDAFNITGPPNLKEANKYGGYNIAYDRLAIIDGGFDPWMPATPHGIQFGAKDRDSTANQPFVLMPTAVHHWDENGLFPNETTAHLPPLEVKDAQELELFAVQEWLQEWKVHCLKKGGCSGFKVQSP